MKMVITIGWNEYYIEAPAAELEKLLSLLNSAVPVKQDYIPNKGNFMVLVGDREYDFVGRTVRTSPITEERFDELNRAAKLEMAGSLPSNPNAQEV